MKDVPKKGRPTGRSRQSAKGASGESTASFEDVLRQIESRGIILESARSKAPSAIELFLKKPVRGNWWSHPLGGRIYEFTRHMRECADILVCTICLGKITYVHRRLWPVLYAARKDFASGRLDQVREVHTASGKHVKEVTKFERWIRPRLKNSEIPAINDARAVLESCLMPVLAGSGEPDGGRENG